MAKNIATIKGRVLKYIDSQGIKKEDFYKKISMNGQSWRGKGAESELSGDKIATVLSQYRDINPYWLLLGEGEMLLDQSNNLENNRHYSETDISEINKLRRKVRDKEKIIEYLESKLGIQKQPKAGKAS